VKEFSFAKSPPVFVEINHANLKAFREGNQVELPLERGPDGRLTDACREKLTAGLRAFAGKKALQSRARAYCALSAAGVSLRRLVLPASAKEEFEKVLRLQIEAEFPLSPDELAWGWLPLETGTAGKREVLVAAVKKEIVAEFREILAACDLEPVFTIAALARNFMCPQPGGSHALLDVGSERPEWAVFENGVPAVLRVLPAASEVSLLESLTKAPGANASRRVIYVTGASNDLAAEIARRLGGGSVCVPLAFQTGAPAAILGLKKAVEQNGDARLLTLEHRDQPTNGRLNAASPELKPWLVRAVVLLFLVLMLPYAEAVILKPFLTRKLTALKADKGRLATIDRELDFLQSLKQSQPPYLDALYLLAKSAPPGTRFETLAMDRQGQVSLHGTMQNGQQVTDFRSKLIASGFFSTVSVDEQTPSPDRQKVTLRMTAHWKPAPELSRLSIGPTPEEIEQARTNVDTGGPGGMPPGMMPGMPMGMPMGMPAGMPVVMPTAAMPPGATPTLRTAPGRRVNTP
jgi:Tfp pilus assembly protein PilN